MEQPVSNESSGAHLGFTLGIVTVAALGGFLFGFDTAVINGAVPVLNEMFMDPDSGFAAGLTISETSRDLWVGQSVALALIGAAIGAFLAGPVTNHIGRKKSMVIAAAMFLASAIGSGLPFTIFDFTFWRFLGGMAFGAASVIAPAYIAEVSPAKYRGRLASMQQLAIVIGIFVALMSNLLIAKNAGGASEPWLGGFAAWKWMFWIEAFPAALYGILAMMIPESPRYLVIQDRDADARRVLAKVLGADSADTKIGEIHESLSSEHKPKLADILGPAVFKKIVWLGIGLSVFQQFVGINVVFYYSNLLWQAVGLTEEDAFINTAIGGATNVLTTFIAIALVDKIGRKPLLTFGSLGMMISLGVMAYVFQTSVDPNGVLDLTGDNALKGKIALVALNLFIVSFGASWGPIVWVMLGEMFSNQIRGAGLAVAASAQWGANYLISATFPLMLGISLGFAYGFYAVSALLSMLFVIFLIPETKGKELEAMGELEN
ncbi:MAG TPA: MFS transporter [Phycisphaerales bacterium]|nr:MFS transporter [Phycisphaerales bacterium]